MVNKKSIEQLFEMCHNRLIMSSVSLGGEEMKDFVERLIEICGTSQPSEVARILRVSYTAAKNYLNGRLPDSNVLLRIAEITPYSIHWLLTGNGDKFVAADDASPDTLLAADRLRTFVRRECVQIVSEILLKQIQPIGDDSASRIVVLNPDQIREEKVMEIQNLPAAKSR